MQECKAEFTPLVQLDEVPVNTGEEEEECLLELCAPPAASAVWHEQQAVWCIGSASVLAAVLFRHCVVCTCIGIAFVTSCARVSVPQRWLTR